MNNLTAHQAIMLVALAVATLAGVAVLTIGVCGAIIHITPGNVDVLFASLFAALAWGAARLLIDAWGLFSDLLKELTS